MVNALERQGLLSRLAEDDREAVERLALRRARGQIPTREWIGIITALRERRMS